MVGEASARPRNAEARARDERKARAQRIAREAARSDEYETAAGIAQAQAALADWDDLLVTRAGAVWSLDGYYKGRRHLGARADLASLLVDIAAAAIAEHEADAHRAVLIQQAVEADAARDEELEALRARVAELEARPPEIVEVEKIVEVAVEIDPLDPERWRTLEQAKAALIVLVKQEAARLVGFSVELFERMVAIEARVAAGIADRDQELELMKHESWAQRRGAVETARQAHVAAIAALPSLIAAQVYQWGANWPPAEA